MTLKHRIHDAVRDHVAGHVCQPSKRQQQQSHNKNQHSSCNSLSATMSPCGNTASTESPLQVQSVANHAALHSRMRCVPTILYLLAVATRDPPFLPPFFPSFRPTKISNQQSSLFAVPYSRGHALGRRHHLASRTKNTSPLTTPEKPSQPTKNISFGKPESHYRYEKKKMPL